MNFLITFSNISWQKGSWAQIDSLVCSLKEIHPEATFTLLSHQGESDLKHAGKYDMKIVGLFGKSNWSSKKRSIYFLGIRIIYILCLLLRLEILIRKKTIFRAYKECDTILDLAGDSFRNPPGGHAIAHIVHFYLCQILNKKTCIISQTIGPFNNLSTPFINQILKKLDYIYIRDKGSYYICQKAGAALNTHLIPDIAFLLNPAEGKSTKAIQNSIDTYSKNGKKIVGMSVSILLYEIYGEKYFKLLNALIHEISFYNTALVFIPHEYKTGLTGQDDLWATEHFLKLNPVSIPYTIIPPDPAPGEIKYIASKCYMMIAGRMHAGIAGLSSGVPVMLMGWSDKYPELAAHIGLPPSMVYDMRYHESPQEYIKQLKNILNNHDEMCAIINKFNKEAKGLIISSLQELK